MLEFTAPADGEYLVVVAHLGYLTPVAYRLEVVRERPRATTPARRSH